MVAAGIVNTALGAGVVIVTEGLGAVVVGPKVTQQVTLLSIGVGASSGFPTLCIARLKCRAVSNFALFGFDHPKGAAKVIVVTFVLCIM